MGRQTASGNWTTHIVWDDLEGFGLRLHPTGRKTWVLKYVNQYRKQRWITIGPFPEYSATKARKEAERLRVVIAEGGDPKADRDRERSGLDVEALADEYLAKYAKQRKKSWAADEDRLKRHVRPAWGKKHPSESDGRGRGERCAWRVHRRVRRPRARAARRRTHLAMGG